MSSVAAARPDDAARERAVTDFATNLCVGAGAGSGKTSLLVERLLEALLARGLALERLVAITFTDLAAAEMRQRLKAAIAAIDAALAEGDDLAAAHDHATRANADEAARFLARRAARHDVAAALLRTRASAALVATPPATTIHSFALRLLRRHPIEAVVPAGLVIERGNDAFARHVRGQLPALVDAELARAPDGMLARLLTRMTLDELADVVTPLAWLPVLDGVSSGARADVAPGMLVSALLAPIATELRVGRPLLPERTGRNKRFYEQWDQALDFLAWIEAHPQSASHRDRPPTGLLDGLDKDVSSAQVDAPGVDVDRYRMLLAKARKRLRRVASLDEPAIANLLVAAAPLSAQLRDRFVRSGRIASDGALALASRLLSTHEAVRRDEAARIDLLAIDEFQDTDPLQCAIALALCRDERGSLPPGRLFLVGDPKQSIYRFRGADLDVYRRTVAEVVSQGGVELTLSTSFRSSRQLVEPVNHFFAAWTDAANDAEPRFDPLHPGRADDRDASVELWEVARPDGREDAAARAEAEGRAIAAAIAAHRAELPRLSEVAILLRDLSDLHWFAAPLRDHAIPFAISGGRTFARRSEVGELASLLMAAADPHDEVAALGALRSALGGATDAELIALKQWRGSLSWPALLDVPLEPARELARHLKDLHDDLAVRPAAAALARFVEGTALLPIAALARDGEQRIANLRKLAERVAERAMAYGLPPAEAIREVVGIDDDVEGESERSLADDELDAVRVLTIHKAKGLEFDWVFVPDIGQPPKTATGRPLSVVGVETGGTHLCAVKAAPLEALNAAQLVREVRDEAHRAAESKRLLYVAMTRAKRRLVLVAGPVKRTASGTWHDALERLLPPDIARRSVPMAERGRAPEPPPLLEPADVARAEATWNEAAALAATAVPRFGRPSAHGDEACVDGEGGAPVARLEPVGERAFLRDVGIVLHGALARSGPRRAPRDDELAHAARAIDGDDAWRARVAAEARAVAAAPPAQRLFAQLRDVTTVAAEVPLHLARDGVVWRGAADLLFRDGDALVLADWKSDRESDDAALAERHRPQLALYRDALAAATGRAPDRMELLLLRHGRRLVI